MSEGERELPQGWAWADLESLAGSAGVISDGDWVESKDQNPDGDVRLIQLADVGQLRFVDKSKRYMDLERAEAMNCLFLKENDLLIARLGDPVGKACLLPKQIQRCVTAVDVMVFRPGSEKLTNRTFISYVVNSPRVRNKINLQLSGTTRKRITGKKLKVTKLPLPPLAEQGRIVDKIDELFSSIEAGERAIEQARAGVARYRKAVLKAAVTGTLTEDWRDQNPPEESAKDLLARILTARYEAWEKAELTKLDAKGKARPETEKQWQKFRGRYKPPVEPDTEGLPVLPKGWIWTSPVHVEDTKNHALAIGPFGSNLKVSDYTEEGVPLVFVRHIRSGKFDGDKPKYVSPDKAKELVAHSVSGGDLLITKMGDPPGEARVYPIHSPWAIITADCIKWTISSVFEDARFFETCVNSALIVKQISKITRGVAQQKVSLARFRQLAFPLPPLAEQAEIVSRVEEALSKADAAEATLDAQARAARALKQAVLKTAFKGKLVPQNPKDEPAIELLKRIKAAS